MNPLLDRSLLSATGFDPRLVATIPEGDKPWVRGIALATLATVVGGIAGIAVLFFLASSV